MKKNYCTAVFTSVASFIILFSSGCSSGSADKKVPELASEMCDCFSSFQQTLSPAGRDLMKAVSVSASPREDMISGMSKMTQEEAAAFAKQMASVADKQSELYKCLEAFDKKHGKETTRDKKALTEKLLGEMQGKANCPTGAAIINMNMAQMSKK